MKQRHQTDEDPISSTHPYFPKTYASPTKDSYLNKLKPSGKTTLIETSKVSETGKITYFTKT